MTLPRAPFRVAPYLALLVASPLAAQMVTVPLAPSGWTATDSVRSIDHLGRPSLYMRRGVALATGAAMENGTLELDLAATDTTTFLGIVFRAASPRFSNVIFLRPGSSGTIESVQYGPALNNLGVAWQVYHFDGANATAEVPRNRWIHLRLELDGPDARLFLDTATTPTLVVPRVVRTDGAGLGLWAGPFGRGAYYSNIRYTPRAQTVATPAVPVVRRGSLLDWELSEAIEAAAFTPEHLPASARLTWQRVSAEPEGFVLVNRYREQPAGSVPRDSTGEVLVDSIMTGKMAGSKVVYARTTITSTRAETRRLEFAYANGVVIYLNGRPLFFGMNPGGFRAGLGVMDHVGEAVYLPLRAGRNELVFAVIESTGGWAYSARLDPR
ncbi:MAG TPA: hypothetical protein VF454_02615 [Gemmatimonadales bacterium]